MSMKPILYIPTIGEVGKAVESYKQNMKEFGYDFPVIVADRSVGKSGNINTKQISKLDGVYHLSEKQILDYLNSISDTGLLKSMGFGNAMNLGYLLATTFKADIMHRRDGDTRAENFLARKKFSKGLDVFGIHQALIGKKIEEVKIISQEKYHPWADLKLVPSEKRIMAVTGGVTGCNPMPLEVFRDFPEGFIKINPQFRDSEKLRKRIAGELVLFDESRFQILSVRNLSGSNVCLHTDVFTKFCCPPADGVGTDDEHTAKLMGIDEMPILFAYAPVGHYESYPDDVKDIVVREFLTKDFILARNFILNSTPSPIEKLDVCLFLTTSNEFENYRKTREKAVLEAVKILLKAPRNSVRNKSLIDAGKYLQKNLTKLLDQNDQYLKNYFILQEQWPELVKNAGKFNTEELF